MTALPPRLESFLGATARQLIGAMADLSARASMLEALEACAVMLAALDGVELDRFELVDVEVPDLSVWNEAAPQVGLALRGLHEGLATLTRLHPTLMPSLAPSDEDFTFDLSEEMFDEPEDRDEAPLTRAGPGIDRAVEEPVDRAISALVAMLRSDVLGFGRKLREASLVASRSALLGELQEFRARAIQCVEALAAAVLRPLGPHPLTALLPRYSTELERSLALRDELAMLSHDVGVENARMAKADAGVAMAVSVAVEVRLAAFGELPSARHLWARDKRELMAVRRFLRAWSYEEGGVVGLRHALEGATRFLELLVSSVSRRPEIEAYDQENAALADALAP